MIPIPKFSSCSDKGYDFTVGRFNRFIFVGRPMIAFVNGGVPPYTWSITGSAFSLANVSTTSQFNRIVTNSNTVVGESAEEVTVSDACGREASFTVSCCSRYLCCDQQTVVFSVDPVDYIPTGNVILNVYGGCPPFSWRVTFGDATFATPWTELRQNTLIFGDIADAVGVKYEITDICGSVATSFVYQETILYEYYYLGGSSSLTEQIPRLIDDLSSTSGPWEELVGSSLGKVGGVWYGRYNSNGELGLGLKSNQTAWTPLILPPGVGGIVKIMRVTGGTTFLDTEGRLWSAGWNDYNHGFSGESLSWQQESTLGTWVDFHKSWQGGSTGPTYCRLFAKDTTGKWWLCGRGVNGSMHFPGGNAPNILNYSSYTLQHSVYRAFLGYAVDLSLFDNMELIDEGGGGTGHNVVMRSLGVNKVYGSGLNRMTALSYSGRGYTVNDWLPSIAKLGHANIDGLLLCADGTIWTWGDNQYGLSGRGAASNFPVQVGTDTDWVDILRASNIAYAKKSDGSTYYWGNNVNLLRADGTGYTAPQVDVPTLWINPNPVWATWIYAPQFTHKLDYFHESYRSSLIMKRKFI